MIIESILVLTCKFVTKRPQSPATGERILSGCIAVVLRKRYVCQMAFFPYAGQCHQVRTTSSYDTECFVESIMIILVSADSDDGRDSSFSVFARMIDLRSISSSFLSSFGPLLRDIPIV